MPVKTFVSGEILTAADTNAYLNNGGLVYIKSQTIGTAVASQATTAAFSSTYDSYFITITNMAVSANQPDIRLTLGAGGTGTYFYGGWYLGYAVGTVQASALNGGNQWVIGHAGNAVTGSWSFTLHNPNLAARTFMNAVNGSTAWSNTYNGYLNDTTQYTDFTIAPSSGTITGGTIRVYGYRIA